MKNEIQVYNNNLLIPYKEIADKLATIIDNELTEAKNKIWHAHPVWFLNDNPIVGYNKQKKGLRLMFWSGESFNEDMLNVTSKKFKDASVFYNNVSEINSEKLIRCLKKAQQIQWDYKNIVKRKGQLERLK